MKKTLIILIVVSIAIFATGTAYCCIDSFININVINKLQGNGNIVSRIIELPAFDQVKASRGVEVLLINDNTKFTTIEADDNIIDHVVVTVSGGELKISLKNNINIARSHNIKVTVPTNGLLRKIEANSAAQISSEVVIMGAHLELEASSAANLNLKVEVADCTIDASSAADITAEVRAQRCEVHGSSAANINLTGAADHCAVEMGSASKLSGYKFEVKIYDVDVSSAAKAKVSCSETLKANASSGASINYVGNCKALCNAYSGGSINKK